MNLTLVDMGYALRMTELNCPVVRGDPSLLAPHVAAWLQECVARRAFWLLAMFAHVACWLQE